MLFKKLHKDRGKVIKINNRTLKEALDDLILATMKEASKL